jgi:predicted amidophosphoribosyltransferase
VQNPVWSEVDGIPLCISGAPVDQLLRVIRAFKDHSRTALARPLAQAIEPAFESARIRFPDVDAFVVPPSPWASWRKRGFRPVPLVLSHAGFKPMPLLRRLRVRQDQRALSVARRRANLEGAFEAVMPLHGCAIALVDDVVTTGATIGEARRAIESAGGRVVCAIALVRVPLRNQHHMNATPNETGG